MKQETRNKIYAVAGALFLVLTTLGIVEQAKADEALTLLNAALDLVGPIVGVITAVIAFVKSLPSKVTVIDSPAAKVAEIVQTDGKVIAGPASPLPTGTVVPQG